jgi:hypothetical protein
MRRVMNTTAPGHTARAKAFGANVLSSAMADHSKHDDRDADLAKAIAEGGKVLKPKGADKACSVCGATNVGLYRHVNPLALYCAKHVPKNAP